MTKNRITIVFFALVIVAFLAIFKPFEKVSIFKGNDPVAYEKFYSEAKQYYDSGDWEKAAETFEKADSAKNNPMARLYKAYSLVRLNKDEEAVEEYRRSIEADSGFVQGYYELGAGLLKFGKTSEAIQNFKKAIELKPDYIAAKWMLARAYFESADYDESLGIYKSLLERSENPVKAKIYVEMAKIYAEKNDREAVSRYIDKAIKIAPYNNEARQVKETLGI